MGFRPRALEGVSECRGWALGGGVGVGLGFYAAGVRLPGQGVRPGSPRGSLVPKWTGKALAAFPSIPFHPTPAISPGSHPSLLDP